MRKKNKPGTMNIILLVIALVLIAFTISMVVVFLRMGSVPDTLIVSVFGACLGEFSIMGYIKKNKIKYEGGNENADTDIYAPADDRVSNDHPYD